MLHKSVNNAVGMTHFVAISFFMFYLRLFSWGMINNKIQSGVWLIYSNICQTFGRLNCVIMIVFDFCVYLYNCQYQNKV